MTERTCSIEGCPRLAVRKGLCRTHYTWQRLGKPLDAPIREYSRSSTGICSVPECGEPFLAKDLCSTHYARMKKGLPLDVPLMVVLDHPGTCAMEGCDKPYRQHGLCNGHRIRASRGLPMDAPWLGTSEDITYGGAHMRTLSVRGPASAHPCADCGGPAEQWSYRNWCESEMQGMNGGSICSYCPHPEHYDPRCRSCHRTFDLKT